MSSLSTRCFPLPTLSFRSLPATSPVLLVHLTLGTSRIQLNKLSSIRQCQLPTPAELFLLQQSLHQQQWDLWRRILIGRELASNPRSSPLPPFLPQYLPFNSNFKPIRLLDSQSLRILLSCQWCNDWPHILSTAVLLRIINGTLFPREWDTSPTNIF